MPDLVYRSSCVNNEQKSLSDQIIRSDRPDYPVRAGLSDLTGRIIRSENLKNCSCSFFTPQGLDHDQLVLFVGYPMLFHPWLVCPYFLCFPLYILFTGGPSDSSKKSKKARSRPMLIDQYGDMTEVNIAREKAQEAEAQKAQERKKKAAEKRKRGKEARTNYSEMDRVEYSTLRQQDWFNQPRDENLTNDNFWTVNQLYIFKDIYEHMNPRPMRPLDLGFLRKKPEFAEAVQVTQRLGLHHLMGIQCPYDQYYVKQFFSTLVLKGDQSLSMKWMTGEIGRASCRERVLRLV